MTLLWLHMRLWLRALLGIRDMRQASLRMQIEQRKAQHIGG